MDYGFLPHAEFLEFFLTRLEVKAVGGYF